MTTRIWFNRTFATATHYVDMIRNNPDGKVVEIYATHPKRHSLMLQAADHADLEPDLSMEQYPQFCIDYCRQHAIDIFIPHFGLSEIAKYADEFERVGTKVMLGGNADLLRLVSDKGDVFRKLADVEGLTIPEYHIVSTAEEFEAAFRSLKEKGLNACFKPVTGEGGAGFRVIDDMPPTLDILYRSIKPNMYIGDVLRMLSVVESFEPLMVMELLTGPEYSVDCLGNQQSLLAAVPRKKVEGRIRALEDNSELIRLAAAIHERIPLQYNFNIQFIYQDDTPKLLEINPRMSGGLYTSCLSGINFPYLAVKMLLNEEIVVPAPNLNLMATHVEKEVLLKHDFNG
ncbi:ATP-grasp domain-containing protein [Paenibacillus tianmuensis]|uniref:ATP-grasp domain-containing protein n=1 Tax=Paenibacillus tianmuensis TaxID=624147 RepID=A0A1G4QJ18_9BACL|nr:ATP-grasp domain-containing protein [Paenibacillus tianmuensis]SCW44610.1 ATP-grasp domain-containing protein [Paenibacillus tianmuensis]